MSGENQDEEFLRRQSAARKHALQIRLESKVFDRSFSLESTSSEPLNVTCYGSSSSKTPERYLEEARLLGYILSKRGHVCVNGAGSFGCMAAMNDGVHAGDGHLRGVTHEMFLVDNGFFDVDSKTDSKTQNRLMRRGSSHEVFENAVILEREEHKNRPSISRKDSGEVQPIRELLVAGGPDLQERKKFLVTNTDALIVLPGGPGTWDELWEMACARHLKLNQLPIVCVNVDGYYEPFRQMLYRAYADKLIHLPPDEIVRFADGAEDAVRFVEGQGMDDAAKPNPYSATPKGDSQPSWKTLAMTLFAGVALGMALSKSSVARR